MKLSDQFHAPDVSPQRLDTHWIGNWVGPRAGFNTAVAKRKIPVPTGNRNPVFRPVASSLYRPSYHGSYNQLPGNKSVHSRNKLELSDEM